MKRKKLTPLLLALIVLVAALAAGCGDDRQDTRKNIRTIGVVITNELSNVFNELYVYPAGDDEEMGQDFIKNTKNNIKVGSFGVTVEQVDLYDMVLRDTDGGVYRFRSINFYNGDFAEVSYDGELRLTISHHGGGTEEVVGEYVSPGDAPDHSYVPLKKQVSYAFSVINETEDTISRITMREADNPGRGEVELFIQKLEGGKETRVSGKLFEEDQEITDWLLYIETDDDRTITSGESFNLWDTDIITVSQEDGVYTTTITEMESASGIASSTVSVPGSESDAA